jgi:hypothetical protein
MLWQPSLCGRLGRRVRIWQSGNPEYPSPLRLRVARNSAAARRCNRNMTNFRRLGVIYALVVSIITKDLIRYLSIGAALCSLPQLSSAQATTDTASVSNVPFHQGRARWSEDWSVLEDPDLDRDDFWRKIKFIPFDAAGKYYLSLGGEYRFTYELFDPAQRGLSDIDHQDTVMNRLALHADLHLGERWRVFGQLGYATATNREGGMQAVDETDPDVWQLFVDCRFTIDENERVVARLGRQIIETGGYLITAGEANNLRLYYDGFRVGWLDRDYVKLEAFVAEYVNYVDGAFDMSGNGEYFWGGSELPVPGLGSQGPPVRARRWGASRRVAPQSDAQGREAHGRRRPMETGLLPRRPARNVR